VERGDRHDDGVVTNKNAITCPAATGASTNPIVGIAVVDAATGGNVLYWASLTSTAIANGDTPKINATALLGDRGLCRLVSLAGANSTFICNGAFFGGPNIVVPFGGTVASIDSSAASALAISVTPSVTGQSYTVQQISWRSLN
jgi:hypothetical protein